MQTRSHGASNLPRTTHIFSALTWKEEKLQDSQRKKTSWQTQFECKARRWMLSVCRQSRMRRNTKRTGEESGFWQGQGSSVLLKMEQNETACGWDLASENCLKRPTPLQLAPMPAWVPHSCCTGGPHSRPRGSSFGIVFNFFRHCCQLLPVPPCLFFPVRELRIT